jgi:hypothetical protein
MKLALYERMNEMHVSGSKRFTTKSFSRVVEIYASRATTLKMSYIK